MKKIIKSLAVVVAVGAIATGATWSFFSDEEKSTGNTFMAGKIDLKVDSEAHYNGMVCQGGVWVDPVCTVNQVANFDFETPSLASGQWDIFPPAEIDWQVEWMPSVPATFGGQNRPSDPQLEYHNNIAGTGQNGNQYVELDSDWDGESGTLNGEPSSVRIFQDVPTVAGKDYTLSFWFSRRPDASSTDTNKLRVTFDGVEVATNLSGDADSVNPNWKQYSFTVQAIDNLSRLAFEDIGTADSYGTYLDHINLVKKDCDVAPGEVQTCDGTWDLTDLVSGTHKFFNFSDVKPGDYGEDTVSLHLSSNDAWGRMVIDVKKDLDNTCVGPELKPEDDDCLEVCEVAGCADEVGDRDGELRENLKFSVWLDEGETPGFQGKIIDEEEGDNIQQAGEIALISAGAIDSDGEEWLIKDAIMLAYDDGVVAPGITADGHMTPGVTYYFGIGWELPSGVGNEAQTDIFEADITFEVEQYRNNSVGFDAS